MNILALDIPEQHAEVVVWLEQIVGGTELKQLVTELVAFYDAERPKSGDFDKLIVSFREKILQKGLGVLPRDLFRRLLTQPYFLFDLQYLIFTEGGRYWKKLESTEEVKLSVEERWRALQARLPQPEQDPQVPVRPTPFATARVRPPAPRSWSVLPWLLIPIVAAAVFAGTYYWLRVYSGEPVPTPEISKGRILWGWNKADALDKAESPEAFRRKLATLLEEWFQVAPKPEDADAKVKLAIRLLELRSGATRLQFTELPMEEAERKSLQDWARKHCVEIDTLLQGLQNGITPQNLLPSVKKLVDQMAEELRSKKFE